MEPRIYSSNDHHIRNDHINPNALFVLKKLHEAGYTAYLVGGSVRDLLLHKRPKDFDISTSAEPEQIKAVFRSCLLIGRRFRLAHVRFGKEIIEVATFRAGDPTQEDLIVRDNIWGDPHEDVMRRDFTINGLFYDPLDHRIIDYVGGFEDLQKNLLRAIGDPFLRFKQDPVRMIRMLKFVARFGFHIEQTALVALKACRQEIVKSSPARVLEEIFRMLESGASAPFFELLHGSDFLKLLFPKLHDHFETPLKEALIDSLKMADSMNHRGHYKPLDRSILTAALLFPILDDRVNKLYPEENNYPHMGEIIELANVLLDEIFSEGFVHFPRKIRYETHFILQMQYRLTPKDRRKRVSPKIFRQRGFLDALIFLKLRALLHPSLFKTYEHLKKHWSQVTQPNEERRGDDE